MFSKHPPHSFGNPSFKPLCVAKHYFSPFSWKKLEIFQAREYKLVHIRRCSGGESNLLLVYSPFCVDRMHDVFFSLFSFSSFFFERLEEKTIDKFYRLLKHLFWYTYNTSILGVDERDLPRLERTRENVRERERKREKTRWGENDARARRDTPGRRPFRVSPGILKVQ